MVRRNNTVVEHAPEILSVSKVTGVPAEAIAALDLAFFERNLRW
jgi:hypothetical protein